MAQENYKTFDFAPYESNFAKGRREELADRTRQEFDANKAEYDILQRTIGSLETTDFNKKYVDQMNADIEGTMQGVLETGRYDLASFAVSDSLTRYMTDNTVKNAVESFQTIKKEDQLIAANPNKYKKYYEVPVMRDENDVEWTAADYNDPNKEGIAELDADDNPVMKDLRQEHDAATGAYLGNHEEAYDHTARASTMMKGIAKNSKFYTWIDAIANKYGVDKEEAARMIMTGEGVTRNRVEGLAEALVEEYASTPEGMQRAHVLSLKLSPNVEYYGKDPLMQLYSDEEIQQVLLNDLIAAGEPQIGETVNIRNIPNPAPPGPSDSGTNRPGDYQQYVTPNTLAAEQNKNYKKTQKAIEDGSSKVYDTDGMLKPQQKVGTTKTLKRGSKTYTVPDTYVDDPDSFTKAYERATATLAEQGSNNPLDIADEYQRSVYINTEFGGLKVDKNGDPIAVSDAEFVHQVEKSLVHAKSIQSTVYKPRTAASQKGTKSGTIQSAENVFNFLESSGTLIFDDQLNPNQGVNLNQWDKLVDKASGLFHLEGTEKDALIELLRNTVDNTKDADKVTIEGLTLRPQSPGATQISFEDANGDRRVLYIKTGELSQKMLAPASGLIEIATNPLEPMTVALPDIFNGKLTQKEKDAGVKTFISNELRSTGGLDAAGNEIPFSIKAKYFVYKGIREADGSITETSKHEYISQDAVNQFIHTAVKAYTIYGPDEATVYDDQDDDT